MKRLLVLCFMVATFTGYLHAATIYGTDADLTGTRTEGSGIVTGGDYGADALTQSLSWEITSLGGGLWSYEYTFVNFSRPDTSHWILDLTDDCVPDNPGCVTDATGGLEFGTFGPAPSTPGFPAGETITGVKFDFGGPTPLVYSFTSNRAPVWGDFYLKGGSDSFAYNAGLVDHSSANVLDFIARPNGAGAVAPEPGSVLLLVGGLLLLGSAKARQHLRRS